MRILPLMFSFIGLSMVGTAAQAEWRGFATADVNMRTGPGTGYSVVDVVPEGARVFVDSCGGNWCDVTFSGENGFISRHYLEQTRVRDYAPEVLVPQSVYVEPDYAEERRARRYRRQLRRERRARRDAEREIREERRFRQERRARRNAERQARADAEYLDRQERKRRRANRNRRRVKADVSPPSVADNRKRRNRRNAGNRNRNGDAVKRNRRAQQAHNKKRRKDNNG